MAIFKVFPEQSATIYSQYPTINTGNDEILDLSTSMDTLINPGNAAVQSSEVSRFLIQFSSSSISDVYTNKIGNLNHKVYLRTFLANAESIPQNYILYCYPVSSSWSRGTGRYDNRPQIVDGVSWLYRTSTNLWSTPGASFITSSASSQSFNNISSKDIELDVTNIVSNWNNGSIINNGFIVKHSSSIEFVTSSLMTLKYFSANTHTIYPPCLEFKYDDSIYITSSNTVNNNQFVISLANNKGEYQQDTIQKFNIYVRDKFPTRVFTTSSLYLNNKVLPSSSYWAIKDLHTEEVVVDFDTNYTKISSDGVNNYFSLYMSGLEPERFYCVLIKSIIGNETLIYDEESFIFKVKR